MTEPRRLLAVSYMLPPALYPQAIQIGRLLGHLPYALATVSGTVQTLSEGLDNYADFESRIRLRLSYPHRPVLRGKLHGIAMRALPLYGRAPDEYRGWARRAAPLVKADLDRAGFQPDVIITFGEPMSDHLLGLRLKPALNRPWVAHFSDPWAGNPFRRYNPLANILNRRDERAVIAAADAVVFTSDETLSMVMRKYPADWHNKCHVLPHAYEPRLYPAREAGSEGRPLVLRYLGNFYGHRSPEPLFRALVELQRRDPGLLSELKVELVGSIPARMLRSAAWRQLPAGLVERVSTVPYSRSLALMQAADLLLVIDGPDDLSVFLPSKLVDYVGTGQPVFGIVPPGASAHLIESLGGQWASPRDIPDIVDKLRRAIETARERRERAEPWGQPAVRERYHIDAVARQFSGIVDTVLSAVR